MDENGFTRREFLRRNSLAGAGALLAMNTPALFAADAMGGTARPAPREPLMYFDALTRIGPRHNKHPAERWSLAHMLTEMDHCSISGALVAYTMSVHYDPMFANLELSRMIDRLPHLFAVWNLMPHQTGEFPAPAELGRLMAEHDVRAVTIHPDANRWDWRAEHSRHLLQWLGDTGTLTMVSALELGGWPAVDEFLRRFPTIPVLLNHSIWHEQRYLLPLLERHANLHITFERFQINEGIEDFYEKGLIDRLVFGTNSPTMSAGAHRAMVDYAAVPQEAKEKVAHGNLIRLLNGQRPPALRENAGEDELMAAARRGEPVPTAILDMHMHILHEGLHGTGALYRMRNGGPAGVFSMMERIGNQGGGIMSWIGVVSGDAPAGNEAVRQALDVAPPGYWGLGSFDPTHFSQAELGRMIPELYRDGRFIGMKPYHLYGVEYHHPSYDVWWEFGNEAGLYALIHRLRNDGLEVETLAAKYPNVRWVVAHSGGTFQWADVAIQAIQKFPNVYAELTYTSVPLGIIEYLVEHVGEDRVVYGSDLPMRDPRQQLGWVLYSDLSLTAKKKMLAGNAYRVIHPALERLPAHLRPAPPLA